MSALSDREAAASPLLSIHERLDELTLAVDAVVTAIDPESDDEAIAEAAEALVTIRTSAAKIRGQVVAGDSGRVAVGATRSCEESSRSYQHRPTSPARARGGRRSEDHDGRRPRAGRYRDRIRPRDIEMTETTDVDTTSFHSAAVDLVERHGAR